MKAKRAHPETVTIGGLAGRTGFSTKAIRYYERIRLLPQPERRPSGYRVYAADDVARLGFIAKAKQLGLSLDEIRDILALHGAGARPCEHVSLLIDRHIERVERTIEQLTEFRRQLGKLRADARWRVQQSGAAICRIIEHAELDGARDAAAPLARSRPGRRPRRLPLDIPLEVKP